MFLGQGRSYLTTENLHLFFHLILEVRAVSFFERVLAQCFGNKDSNLQLWLCSIYNYSPIIWEILQVTLERNYSDSEK